jgi:hypothetical protein
MHVYVTGHSKGADKAMYVGVLRGDEISHVYSLGGQGFSNAFWAKYPKLIEANKSKLTNIAAADDFTTTWLHQVVQTEYLVPQSTWGVLDGTLLFGAPSPFDDLGGFIASVFSSAVQQKITGTHDAVNLLKVGSDGIYHLAPHTDQNPFWKFEQQLFTWFQEKLSNDDYYYSSTTLSQIFVGDFVNVYHPEVKEPDGFKDRFDAVYDEFMSTQQMDLLDRFIYAPLIKTTMDILFTFL